MVLERSIYSDFVFVEAMYNQGYIRKECELYTVPSGVLVPLLMGVPLQRLKGGYFMLLYTIFPGERELRKLPLSWSSQMGILCPFTYPRSRVASLVLRNPWASHSSPSHTLGDPQTSGQPYSFTSFPWPV